MGRVQSGRSRGRGRKLRGGWRAGHGASNGVVLRSSNANGSTRNIRVYKSVTGWNEKAV